MKPQHLKRLKIAAMDIVLVCFGVVGCGQEIQETKIKDYRLHVQGDDLHIKEVAKSLIEQYNQKANRTVLKYTDSADEATSILLFTKGLAARPEKKIGWGQWMSESLSKPDPSLHSFSTNNQVTVYRMRLEFDYDYVMSRWLAGKEEGLYDVTTLFCHEVGHGLQMNHDAEQKSVMYKEVGGPKDFDEYFRLVNAYMNESQ